MPHRLRSIEIKAFVPAKDYALSQRFYADLGFERVWALPDLTYFRTGNSSFLLQNFFNEDHAANFMMHLLVEDADAWWHHVQSAGLVATYGVRAEEPQDRPWGIRDFVLVDPTGVLWRVGHVLARNAAADDDR